MVASGGCIRLLAACVQQPQATCASQANESRRHALQEGQLCRPGRSKMCSWKGRRGKPTEMKLLVQWRKRLSLPLSTVCIKGATVDWRCCVRIDK